MKAIAGSTNGISISGNVADRRLRVRLLGELRRTLGRLDVAPVRGTVRFIDENGPKGGLGIRCALTVRLPYRPAIRIEHMAQTARLAFDGVMEVLARRLEQYCERQRESRRRPKKYYAAKRLLESQ